MTKKTIQVLFVLPVFLVPFATPKLDAAPLLAHYRFDNAADFTPSTGDAITDSSGNNRHGTEGSNITWSADGVRGGGILTSAATNGPHFSVAFPSGLIAGDSFTISFWVRTGATGTADNWKDWGRLDFSDGTTTQHAQLRSLPVAAPNNGGFYFRDPAYEFWPRNSTVNIKDNQWHMVTTVVDGTTLTLYIDGGNSVTFTDYPRGSAFSLVGLRIGNGNNTSVGAIGTVSLAGSLDEVRLYGGPLSAAAVSQLYAATLADDERFEWDPAAADNAWLDAANWTGGDPPRAPGETGDPGSANDDLAMIGAFAFDAEDGLNIDMDAAGAALALGAIWSDPTGADALRIRNASATPGVLRLNGQSVAGEGGTILRVEGAADFTMDGTLSLGLGQATNVVHVAAGRRAHIAADLLPTHPSAGLTLDGAGTLVLTGDNSYREGTILRGGMLEVENISDTSPSQMGITGGSNSRLSIVGGALRYTGTGAQSTTRRFWADAGTASIEIAEPGASLTLSPSAGTRSRPFTKDGPGTLVMNGAFSGAALLDVTAGTLTLGATNTHVGDTRVADGAVLEATQPLALQNSTTVVESGGLVRLIAGTPSSFPIGALDGAGVIEAAGHNLTAGGNGRDTRFTGSLTAAALRKSGAGMLHLDAGGSFGALTLDGGTLAIGSNPGFAGDTITLQQGTLRLLDGGNSNKSIILEGDATDVAIDLGVALDYLIVAGGGGGGGRDSSGGGGAGGVLTNVGADDLPGVFAGSALPVRVGDGGIGGVNTARGGNGQPSMLGGHVAVGGGAGAPYNGPAAAGGSGGGGGREGAAVPGGAGTPGQGFAGGAGSSGNNAGIDSGGGGGGAGETGETARKSVGGGKGGDGLQIDIDGTPRMFGGGGGGTPHRNTPALPSGGGGAGGGGDGAVPFGPVNDGLANTGGGGGASRGADAATWVGGKGGSGIVIARYPGEPRATGGTIAAGTGSAEGYTIHTFTETGDHLLDFNLIQRVEQPIAGPGGFTFTGSGTLLLAADNEYLGDTRVASGTLQVGDGGNTGTLGAGAVTVDGMMVIRRADPFLLGQMLAGDGTLVHAGPESLTLTAENPFTGDIVVQDGGLVLAESGTLTFRIGRHSVSNRITGAGTATIHGTFHLWLADGPLRIHGSSWILSETAATTFGPAFAITSDLGSFTRADNGRHVLEADGQRWTFDESTRTLTLSAPEPGTFTEWIDGYFPGEIGGHITGPRADPDGDGLANIVEFILGGHPNQPDTAIRPEAARVTNPNGLPEGEFLRFSFRRTSASHDAGVEPLVQFSEDLETWHAADDAEHGVTMAVTPDGHGPGVDRVDVFIPAAAESRMFARLGGIDTRPPGDPDAPPLMLEFGVISDVHFGYFPDATAHLQDFIDDMHAWDPDFIIQLGDFCRPEAASNNFMALYNSWPGPKYHVIGNHERDGGYTFQQAADYWGMPGRYHTFDEGPVRGIVLDGNEPGGTGSGYAAFVGPAQQDWLAAQLAATDRPVVIFIHQPIEFLENGDQVRAILEAAEAERPGVVLAVIAGHRHRDYVLEINNIPYIQINSAAYYYFSGRVDYSDSLWARVSLDFETRQLRMVGREGAWATTDPWQRGASEAAHPRDEVRPAISDRILTIREESAAMAYDAWQNTTP